MRVLPFFADNEPGVIILKIGVLVLFICVTIYTEVLCKSSVDWYMRGEGTMRNHEVTARQPLLDEDGYLREPGWSKRQVQVYDRSKIKAPAFRIKEWDYYLVLNEDFAGAFTISDDGYIGLQSVSLLNFKEGWEHTETILNPFTMGRLHLPSSSEEGNTVYHDKRLHMEFRKEGDRRRE